VLHKSVDAADVFVKTGKRQTGAENKKKWGSKRRQAGSISLGERHRPVNDHTSPLSEKTTVTCGKSSIPR